MPQLCASKEWCIFIGHEYITEFTTITIGWASVLIVTKCTVIIEYFPSKTKYHKTIPSTYLFYFKFNMFIHYIVLLQGLPGIPGTDGLNVSIMALMMFLIVRYAS